MDLKDAKYLVHFRELHFLPRVIFAIGGVSFVGAFFVKQPLIGALGIVVIFAACTLNLVINTSLAWQASKQTPWALLLQALLSLAIFVLLLCLTYHYRDQLLTHHILHSDVNTLRDKLT